MRCAVWVGILSRQIKDDLSSQVTENKTPSSEPPPELPQKGRQKKGGDLIQVTNDKLGE
jgi:hypothetical protein